MFYSFENVCTYAIHARKVEEEERRTGGFLAFRRFPFAIGRRWVVKARAYLHVCNVSAQFAWNSTITSIHITRTGYKSCEMDFALPRSTIKVTQSFCFPNLPGVLFFFSRSFLIMKSKL